MNFDFGTIHSVWTVLLVILFLGIVFWAYGRNRKSDFEAAAKLPLNDEPPATGPNDNGLKDLKEKEQNHG